MVAALCYYPLLLAIHRPLGLAILAFAVVRLVNRLTHRPPPFLAMMSLVERRFATWSEYLMYALLLAQPLIGWAMLSAAGSPITIYGPIHLPGIAPFNIAMYELLRWCHIVAALSLFLVFTAHVGVVLFHTLVLRDRMITEWRCGRPNVRGANTIQHRARWSSTASGASNANGVRSKSSWRHSQ